MANVVKVSQTVYEDLSHFYGTTKVSPAFSKKKSS
jgi:hypothetical protein